ncbi:hypothetical protein ERJ75_000993000 [Trypanosoma vivax]|uniref:Uncharacterized protein n=1 Tax=Trypanosoma vivax (strain Y486) TaxID=1055687 RepID=G0UAN6_TRYVY|nr:hypothetical protein TRVL_00497 [Trypanosoma vivax]KAH8611415.1 hypothetical protein ERJ75_000993000 [Trypanosoma vivax]CCC52871.1 conserved hypothetical protein [Trypanosoma vivax Y486]
MVRFKTETDAPAHIPAANDDGGIQSFCPENTSLLSKSDIDDILNCYSSAEGGECGNGFIAANFVGYGPSRDDLLKIDEKLKAEDEQKLFSVSAGARGRKTPLNSHAAALPMFLQSEALVLRGHEQNFRHHMKELIELSECITMLCDGTLRQQASSQVGTSPGSAEGNNVTHGKNAYGLDGALFSPRLERDALSRMLRRVEDLERYVRAAAVERVRSAQRMVFASEVALRRHKIARKAATQSVKNGR